MKLAALALTALLAGCATTAGYEAIAKGWIGRTEADLIAKAGPPDSVYDGPEGMKYLTWRNSANYYNPGSAPTYSSTVVGNTVVTRPTGGSPGYGYTLNCTTSFGVRGGIVQTYRFEGNGCTARPDSK